MWVLGNILALLGGVAGIGAAYLWWVAADTAVNLNVDSLTDDLIDIGRAAAYAAFATAIAIFLMAIGETFRTIFRRWT